MHGASVNVVDRYGRTPLHRAAYKGHTEVAEALVAAGADPAAADRDGDTPLHDAYRCVDEPGLACTFCFSCVASYCVNPPLTLLSLSDSGGHLAVVQLLVEVGASLAATNLAGTHACYPWPYFSLYPISLTHTSHPGTHRQHTAAVRGVRAI